MIDQMVLPEILDACCGPRMMWFDSKDTRALYIDKRAELHLIDPTAKRAGRRPRRIEIAPDIVASFTEMPFADESFRVVVFDPPHMEGRRAGGPKGQFRRMYGALPNDWRATLRAGFSECFRVLKPHGLLVFKWAELSFGLANVLELTPHKPLFGHRIGVHTHWCVFLKGSSSQNEVSK
jgi:ubiquinone/menaquinone biosynthesis C-methylase UbiE